jgi:hypothetical protein
MIMIGVEWIIRILLLLAWSACWGKANEAKQTNDATGMIYYLLLGLQFTLLLIVAWWPR